MKHKRMVGNMPHYKAYSKLMRIARFKTFKNGGKNFCHGCQREIKHPNEMTLQHIKPWRNRGDKSYSLLTDKSNIAFAHPQCNINDKRGASGYIGVNYHKNYGVKKWQAIMKAKNKTYSLKYWHTKEQAAMRRDLFAMEYHKGDCLLNFDHLREFYEEVLQTKDYGFLEDEQEVKNRIN